MFSRAVVTCMLLTFVVVILLPDESLGSCDAQAVQKCTSSQDHSVPTVITSESLDKWCKNFEDAISCIDNAAGCLDNPNDRASYQGLRNVVDNLCGTLRTEFMTHANCYESSEMNATENHCASLGRSRIDTLCEQQSYTISCLVWSVDACCGSDAAQILARLMKELFAPLSDSTGCQLRTDLEMDVPVVCVSERGLEYTTAQQSNGMPSHHLHDNHRLYLAFIGVGLSLYIRLLFQTYNYTVESA